MTHILGLLINDTVAFGLLAIIWKPSNLFNTLVKIWLFILTLGNLIAVLNLLGYIVKR